MTAAAATDVGIVMRTRDRPLLLERAVTDVTRQTFPSWHLVIINDGGSPTVVDEIVARLEAPLAGRVTVLHNERSRGMEAASNQGVEAIDARYVAVHDDDDTWHPEFLERTVAHLEATPEAAGVVSRATIVWERVEGEHIVETGREVFGEAVTDVLLSDHMLHNRFVPISLLYRRVVHETVGLFRDDLPVVGDWEFNVRLLTHFRVDLLEGEPLAFWHQRRQGPHGNTVTTAGDLHRRFDGVVRNDAFVEYVREHGPGLPLYLTGFIDGRLVQVEQGLTRRIEQLEAALAERLDEGVRRHNDDRLRTRIRRKLRLRRR